MKAALMHGLLIAAFVCMQLSQYESAMTHDDAFYERVLGRDPGICGGWYRDRSKTEDIMKCVLNEVPHAVKKQWEDYMDKNSLNVTELASEICNLTTIMPSSFVWYGDGVSTKEYNDLAEKAGIECTAKITGWSSESRLVAAPSQV
ncbi:uncharacterized protein LOC121837180 [Ixodes scapularis]|uniref:uncharacterized protein LOC121837180 n=1 Tax=Ixodes scapularis TaxID=6945 RepID=UPI001C38A8BF|nr:uncharacterized protein LOC121837180 [Ixodes scapularis]